MGSKHSTNKFNCKYKIPNGQNSTDNNPNNSNSGTNNNNININNKNISIVVPYIHGLGERLKRTYNNMGIQVHFKGTNTIKSLCIASKNRDHKLQKSGVIYNLNTHALSVQKNIYGNLIELLGKGSRKFLGLHPFHYHSHSTGHLVSSECFTIVDRDLQVVFRNIKEAMYIYFNDPSLNFDT